MLVKFFNIAWCIDGWDDDNLDEGECLELGLSIEEQNNQPPELPDEVILDVDYDEGESDNMNFDEWMDENGADILTDNFGWYVNDYHYKLPTHEEIVEYVNNILIHEEIVEYVKKGE